MIRSCEHVLHKVFGSCLLTGEILVTTFCLIVLGLNARESTPVSTDSIDLDAQIPKQFFCNCQFNVPHSFPTLPTHSSQTRPSKSGSLVWIEEPAAPRGHYPRVHVVTVDFGTVAAAGSVETKLSSGIFVRPLVKLAPVPPIREHKSFYFLSCSHFSSNM